MEKSTLIDKLGRAISIGGNFILMNLLFLAASIPIVTMGQAWCGLISAVRYNIRGDKWLDGFKEGFKTRFFRGVVIWVVMLAIDLFFTFDTFANAKAVGFDVPTVMSGLILAVMVMITFALLLLNVFVPTDFGQMFRNAVNMIFKAPIELLGTAAMFWAPVLLFRWRTDLFLYVIMIFITVYFTLTAVLGTLVLKHALVYYLLEARMDGTLLADVGKKPEAEEENEETESDGETENE